MLNGFDSGQLRRRKGRGLVLALAFSLAAIVGAGTAVQAGSGVVGATPGEGYLVDHDGIYLAQRIGQCMNGTGPCYFGGQCPGGEYTTNAYALPHIYCHSFIPKKPYPPTFFESLLTGRW